MIRESLIWATARQNQQNDVHPAISLGIHPVWSVFLSTGRNIGSLATYIAPSDDWSDCANAQVICLCWVHIILVVVSCGGSYTIVFYKNGPWTKNIRKPLWSCKHNCKNENLFLGPYLQIINCLSPFQSMKTLTIPLSIGCKILSEDFGEKN